MEAQESGWIEFKSKDKRKLMLLLKNREQILLSPQTFVQFKPPTD